MKQKEILFPLLLGLILREFFSSGTQICVQQDSGFIGYVCLIY